MPSTEHFKLHRLSADPSRPANDHRRICAKCKQRQSFVARSRNTQKVNPTTFVARVLVGQ